MIAKVGAAARLSQLATSRVAVLAIGVHPGGDFGHAFLRARLVPIAARCSADAEPSNDLIAALDRDPASNGYNIGKAEKRRASACRFLLTVSAKALVRSKPKIGPIVTTV